MNEAQKAANNETKSSVGDKYETTRAMMQLEKEKNAQQLSKSLDLKKQLEQIDYSISSTSIGAGSIVYTNYGNFFIAVGLGKLEVENETWLAISLAAPIGQKFKGMKKGDTLSFNQRQYEILDIA